MSPLLFRSRSLPGRTLAAAGALLLAQGCGEPQVHGAPPRAASTTFDASTIDSSQAAPAAAAQTGAAASFGGGGSYGFGTTVIVTGAPQQPTRCPLDDDALSPEQELDAGLDPCKADSDDDGCNDTNEYFLGGCDDARKIVIQNRCFANTLLGTVQFVAPGRDAGPWAKLTLLADTRQLPAHAGVSITVGQDDAGVRSGGETEFVSVMPGAGLRFDLCVSGSLYGNYTVPLTLVDESGQVIDRGTLVVVVNECPLVI